MAGGRVWSFLEAFMATARISHRTTLGYFMRIDLLLGMIFVAPFLQVAFFATLAHAAANPGISVPYIVVGSAVSSVTFATILAISQTTEQSKSYGIAEHLLLVPTNRLAIWLGQGFFPGLVGIGNVLVVLAYCRAIFGTPLSPEVIPALVVTLVLTAAALSGLGLILAGAGLYLRNASTLGNLLFYLLLLDSGSFFPVSQLPAPLQWLAEVLPLTWGVRASRSALADAPTSQMASSWFILVLFAVVTLAFASFQWRNLERGARRTGSLTRY